MNDYLKEKKIQQIFSLTYKNAIFYVIVFLLNIVFTSVLVIIANFFLERTALKTVLITLNVLPFILTILWAFYSNKRKHITLSFSFYPTLQLFPILILLTLCMLMLSNYAATFIPHEYGFLKDLYDNFDRTIKGLMHPKWLLIVATCIFAPIFEEMFFRGLLLKGLLNRARSKKEVWLAIIFTSFLFGLVHMNPWQFTGGMISGIALGYVYYCTRSLSDTIFIHFLNNSLSIFLLFFYGDSEPSQLKNYPDYYNLLFLFGLVFLLFMVKKSKYAKRSLR